MTSTTRNTRSITARETILITKSSFGGVYWPLGGLVRCSAFCFDISIGRGHLREKQEGKNKIGDTRWRREEGEEEEPRGYNRP